MKSWKEAIDDPSEAWGSSWLSLPAPTVLSGVTEQAEEEG